VPLPLDSNAVVEVTDGEPALPAEIERVVANIWDSERMHRPSLFNGRLFSVDTVRADHLRGHFVEYRRFIAQQREPRLFSALGVRPLAVSGLLRCSDGIAFGLRSTSNTQDAGRWELVPSGGIDEGCCAGNRVDPRIQIMNELKEELGVLKDEISRFNMFILMEDSESHVLDIGIEISTNLDGSSVISRARPNAGEYAAFRVVPAGELEGFVRTERTGIVPVSIALLRARGLLTTVL
jgi:hypothetical protein